MDKVWKAKWIIDPQFYKLAPINIFHKEMTKLGETAHRDDLKNRHMLVRKKFTVTQDIKNMFIDITADDYYKLYINGNFVGQGPAPAYYFNYNYNKYDITKYLRQGENVIAVHVYYQGLINRVWNSGDYRQGMIAEVFADNKLLLTTDSTWKYKITNAYQSGGTIGYETQFLENIDSRLWDSNWKDVAYDDTQWENVCENLSDDHKLYLQSSSNLSVYSVKPQKVKKLEVGHYLIDFGEEITGQFQMKANGKSGQVIEIRCGEELEDNDCDSVRYKMRCNCIYQEFWTLSGEDDLLEFYDYKGFRYVEVIAPENTIITDSFSAVVRHYPFSEDRFKFSSSNELINKIIHICKNGVKYGAQESYVDCPTREKGQYLGDLTITGHSHIYLTGDIALYRKALKDFALSTWICPGIMAVAPGGFMQEIADYSMQWPMQLLLYYKHSGDMQLLKEMYPIIEKLESYFEKYKRDDGLLENVDEKWNMVDWPQNLRDEYDFDLTKPIGNGCHNVINAFYYGMLKYNDEIRDILGMERVNNLECFKQTFNKVFYNNTTKLFVDAENSKHSAIHSNALPLFFDMFSNKDLDPVINLIKEKASKCGVYMEYFVLKALSGVGEYELIYKLIKQLWGNMVKEGATTCFEAWGKDQKWNTSLCHPWASSPIPIIIEDIIGLHPGSPGWNKINFTPHIPDSLTNFKLEVTVKSGKIVVEKNNGCVEIKGPVGVQIES